MRPILVIATLLAIAPLAAAALPANAPVAAVGFNFASPVLVVPAGTTVEFVGAALPHTVTSAATMDDALAGVHDNVYRADLPMGASATRTFTEAGEYPYYCELHVGLGMIGTIHVV